MGRTERGPVLVVSHEASRSGAPWVALQICEALRDVGVPVCVALRWGGPLRPDFDRVSDQMMDEPWSRVRSQLRRTGRTKALAPKLGVHAAGVVIDRVRPRLVWANTVVSAPYVIAAANRGVPVVFHAHEPKVLVERVLRQHGLPEAVASASSSITLVGCATETASILVDAMGGAFGEARVLHSTIDVASVRARARRGLADGGPTATRRVLSVGLATRGKGVDVFAEAATIARERGVGAEWRWVGAIDGIAPAGPVEWTGPVGNAAPEIAAADVFVLPFREAPFPLVLLEAMALARPIVASRLPGPVEQLGTDSAILVEPGDAHALVAAVEALLDDPARAAGLGHAAQVRCEQRWDVSNFRRGVVDLVEELSTV